MSLTHQKVIKNVIRHIKLRLEGRSTSCFALNVGQFSIWMKWCELREYKWNEYVTIAVNRNLSNCEKARKKGFRGFNGIRTRGLCVSAAVLYQPELWRPIHWRPANLLSSSTRERNETQNEMMWTAGIQMKWPASSVWVFIAQAGRALQR